MTELVAAAVKPLGIATHQVAAIGSPNALVPAMSQRLIHVEGCDERRSKELPLFDAAHKASERYQPSMSASGCPSVSALIHARSGPECESGPNLPLLRAQQLGRWKI